MAWLAAAPGRIEPRSGLIRIGAAVPGRVTTISARIDDKVAEGEVLIRVDDKEARARLVAAEAEAAARKRERDAQPATAGVSLILAGVVIVNLFSTSLAH